jgi:hypothetical protein
VPQRVVDSIVLDVIDVGQTERKCRKKMSRTRMRKRKKNPSVTKKNDESTHVCANSTYDDTMRKNTLHVWSSGMPRNDSTSQLNRDVHIKWSCIRWSRMSVMQNHPASHAW